MEEEVCIPGVVGEGRRFARVEEAKSEERDGKKNTERPPSCLR